MAVQAGPGGPLNFRETLTAVHHTMSSVFPTVFPYRAYIPSFGSAWGFILASLGPVPTDLSPEEIDTRLAARVTRPLLYYDGITNQGLFHLPKYLREGLAQEGRLITRDNPLYAT